MGILIIQSSVKSTETIKTELFYVLKNLTVLGAT